MKIFNFPFGSRESSGDKGSQDSTQGGEFYTYFEQPFTQMVSMLLVVLAVICGVYIFWENITEFFYQSKYSGYILGLIIFVFLWGVVTSFSQIFLIFKSVRWIGLFINSSGTDNLPSAPSLLAPLSSLLGSTSKRLRLTTVSAQSLLDTVASRVEEHRESTRYITNLLIYLGLLGTFIGLAIAIPQISEFIQSLAEDRPTSNLFEVIIVGLEGPLSGMGLAFSSSLMGLIGSLVVGLLDLFVSNSQNRFYRTLEDWVSKITKIGVSQPGVEIQDESYSATPYSQEISDLLLEMRNLFIISEQNKAETMEAVRDLNLMFSRIMEYTEASTQDLESREQQSQNITNALYQIVENQAQLSESLEKIALGIGDSETRLLLRSIELQLLRILEDNANAKGEIIRQLSSISN
ncbi:MAG: biopolymer transporter ExbB [Rhodobacteraceae bacterium]|nr:biopolymer transporter ExbB [Paracoccaceae bacterium]MYF44937.1 biopolymer transporter ExbB [Paracoccaceae bacterium]MYI90554.1 biopolymer transporter ExbB [Paracoccaceae bacterium]